MSSPLSEAEWEQVFALAAAGRGRPTANYLEQLRAQGCEPRVLDKLALQLELGDVPERPDRHRRGERIGPHIELRGHLREGGAGSVYLATYDDGHNILPVAVKLLRVAGDAPQQVAIRHAWEREHRLLREFSASGKVSPLVEAGEHRSAAGTFLYLCTEYKHGLNLTHWCEQHRLDVARRLELLGQVCDAVATVHAHGLVHGDLKPDNIQVEMRGGTARAWLLDLGLATPQGQMWHGQDQLVGSPGYMSPEQLSDRYGPVTEASDIYALGMLLFELLEGRPWLDVRGITTASALQARILESTAPRLSRVSALSGEPMKTPPLYGLQARLQSMLDRATSYRPRDRYPQVSMLRAALTAVIVQDMLTGATGDPASRTHARVASVTGHVGLAHTAARSGAVAIAALLALTAGYWLLRAPSVAEQRRGRPVAALRSKLNPAAQDAGGVKPTVESGVLVLTWPGSDAWDVFQDGTLITTSFGSAPQALQAGLYTIRPRRHRVFSPFEISIAAGQSHTVRLGGLLELSWPGSDCWHIYRSGVDVGTEICGSGKQALQAGIYTVKPRLARSFEPFEVSIVTDERAHVALGGVLEFQWPGSDCWRVYSEDVDIGTLQCGSGKQALQAGKYTVKAWPARVFEPFEVTITTGATSTVRRGGLLEFNWPGEDAWGIYKDNVEVSPPHQGAQQQALEAGTYVVKARDHRAFRPVAVTIRTDQTTVIEPRHAMVD